MEKQNWKFYWKWSVFVLMTMLCLLSFYKSYHNVKYELQEESQTLFQQAVQDDTNRRIKDLGDAFCFSYSGANRLERDTITIQTADTIIHMKNNKEVARRMSSQEKSDFCLQFFCPWRIRFRSPCWIVLFVHLYMNMRFRLRP